MATKTKERCPKCGLYFVNLSKHIKCKATKTEKSSERDRTANESLSTASDVSSDVSINSGASMTTIKRRKMSDHRECTPIDSSVCDIEPDDSDRSSVSSEQLEGKDRHIFTVCL